MIMVYIHNFKSKKLSKLTELSKITNYNSNILLLIV